MDGVDAAVIETDAEQNVKTIASHIIHYPDDFQKNLKQAENECAIAKGNIKQIQNIKALTHESANYHLKACKELIAKAKIDAKQIAAIGYHGQTFYHDPKNKITVQVGDAAYLAAQSNITTVFDFRSQDVELGGQGAPIVPIYHHALVIKYKLTPCIILNLGGIANISIIPDDSPNNILGFDIGPANTLIDRYLRKKSNGKIKMDEGGKLALAGDPQHELINLLYEKIKLYHFQAAPKSLDSHDFSLPNIFYDEKYSAEDITASLVNFSIQLIVAEINKLKTPIKNIIVCGGGAHNQAMLNKLREHFDTVKTATDLNWNIDTIEAECMAYLAARRLMKKNTNYPNITGLKKPISAGKIIHVDK